MSSSTRDPILELDGRSLSLEDVERVAVDRTPVSLEDGARDRMNDSRAVVERALAEGRVVYGVTTGFGKLSDSAIEPDEVRRLQVNLIRSHAVGVGDPLPEPEARAVMVLRANTLAGGRCGVRPEVCERLLECLNAGVYPRIPAQGSVGASGDLAPLSHLALVLIGEGEARSRGEWVSGGEVLEELGIEPLQLDAKEGLALINGTQVMTAIGALALLDAERMVESAEVAGALTLEATRGTRTPFRPEVHDARPHPGQRTSASRLRALLGESSEIAESHEDCDKVQDAYSIRCMPQVHGATRDALAYVRGVLEIEVNSATDNPLVFSESESGGDGPEKDLRASVVSAGNFHGAPVAAALDFLSIALTDLAAISERRVELLMDSAFSGLPVFLAPDPGLQSGFMMYQVTAAALVSECKGLAHPASVDTIPTSANKEDHVSMGVWAARKGAQVVENVGRVIGIELLAAAQGIDLLRPLKASSPLEEAHRRIRLRVPALSGDRPGGEDVEAIAELVRSDHLSTLA